MKIRGFSFKKSVKIALLFIAFVHAIQNTSFRADGFRVTSSSDPMSCNVQVLLIIHFVQRFAYSHCHCTVDSTQLMAYTFIR